MHQNEKVVMKGTFDGIAYSSAKKYSCKKGELLLTSNNLVIKCAGNWSKTFSIREIRLEAWNGIIEVYDFYYGKLLLRLISRQAKEWEKAFREINDEYYNKWMKKFWEEQKKKPEEAKQLLDIGPKELRNLYNDIRKERMRFGMKNIEFNLEIQALTRILKNRKLKAFILAHSYVAWYEWTKSLLSKIYKARFGKGPKDDEELIGFLNGYPTLGVLDTKEWGIEANQIRNCVAHQKFYYDYKYSELIFVLNNKEKRIKLRDLETRFASISNMYIKLIEWLKEKITKGEISVDTYGF